jgi:hypothetical protein
MATATEQIRTEPVAMGVMTSARLIVGSAGVEDERGQPGSVTGMPSTGHGNGESWAPSCLL